MTFNEYYALIYKNAYRLTERQAYAMAVYCFNKNMSIETALAYMGYEATEAIKKYKHTKENAK